MIAAMRYPQYVEYPSGDCGCGEHAQCYCDVLTGYSECLCDRGYTHNAARDCIRETRCFSLVFDSRAEFALCLIQRGFHVG